ncbi:MAG: hypothetical protein E7167_01980 [Firmicutes bacterium]|nr:hypothetical protein [Bacillota bacterium]
MKNIVTIDFDIIMAPCIDLYNHLVPRVPWFELRHIPQLNLLTADMFYYQRLTEYLISLLPHLRFDQIHFVYEHQTATFKMPGDEKLTIYNIDHHHDCGYHDEQEPISEQDLTCANWVRKIKDFDLLERYIWIKNVNSDLKPEDFDMEENFMGSYNLEQIPIPDQLILVLSPQWVPEDFYPLFKLWQSIVTDYYKQPAIIE